MTFPPDATATPGAAPSAAQPGVIIADRYELIAKVGDGGHGTVWRAHDRLLQRDVAVKEVTLPPGLPPREREQLCDRTLREARAAASLSHASVVRVFDVVTEDGRPWIVMELLKARSLADIISAEGPMPPRVVAKIGLALASALEAAHEAGIVHRDIKPGNVMISADGRCVLSDFGAAAADAAGTGHTAPGMVLGSAHYIAPERAVGGPAEPPSDLFSLGVTLYAALEGRPPFDRGSTTATMNAVVHDPPEAPRNAGPLAPLLAGLLDKNPRQRFDVRQTRDTLAGLLAGPLSADGATGVLPTSGGPISGIPDPASGYSVSAPPSASVSGGGYHHGAATMPVSAPGHGYPPRGGYSDPHAHSATPFPAPPKKQNRNGLLLGAGIAVVVVALLTTLGFVVFGGDDEDPSTDNAGNDSQQDDDFEYEKYTDPDGRFTVEVPKGWKPEPNGEGTFVDVTDPDNQDRWLRLRVVDHEGEPKAVLENAVANGIAPAFDKASIEQRKLEPGELSGMDGYVLEYTGTRAEDGQQRHALWMVGSNGVADHHVYLSVTEKTWKESTSVFEHAVETYAATG